MAFESIAHSAINSESIRARGIIVNKLLLEFYAKKRSSYNFFFQRLEISVLNAKFQIRGLLERFILVECKKKKKKKVTVLMCLWIAGFNYR